ncbi:P-loop containing nucleoside triphosphate hydrolases superfamily protein [Actinidia rufa]|uniref:P-loop containing nucleoside triphosphate hydrolases superfamily protein n=1 Tax=Actinidia rufa TaxID=165716 RepID=A0A7J0GH31_9ERIC|nr:P-loop containing nucleoside triphosphate hydrolases superfamily protein [Actinidia rufa]
MGSRERLLFDLNELPAEEDEQTNDVSCVQPQKTIPSSTHTSDLFATLYGFQKLVNNHSFSHASSVSGFQPFVRPKSAQGSLVCPEQIRAADLSSEVALLSKTSNGEKKKTVPQVVLSSSEIQAIEKEEGEWSDAEDSAEAYGSSSMREQSLSGCEELQEKQLANVMDHCGPNENAENVFRNDESIKDENSYHSIKDENSYRTSLGSDVDKNDQKSSSSRNSEGNCKGDISMDGQEEAGLVPRQREVKGVEASHALKSANNPGKRPRFDQHKEAMLGKKRSRQTMFLNLEDVKQAGSNKTSTPRRQNFPAPITTRTVKETRGVPPAERTEEKQSHSVNKDSKQVDLSSNKGHTCVESTDPKSESNGDINSGFLGKPRRLNSATDLAAEVHPPSIPRQISWKQLTDSRQLKNSQVSTRKQALNAQSSVDPKLGTKRLPSKKPAPAGNQYQDTSVERLLREVTNEKFWHHPEEAELQCVPGRFESVEEYVRVFEPLLFEECRAQLYSTWEELTETASRDLHVMVCVRSVERRERGWYDVIVLPSNECKWTFKEGDVAVLSTPRPGIVRSQRNNTSAINNDDELEVSGRVAGTVRRYVPIDTRDPLGAILHFYVGDSYDPNSKVDTDHILSKLQPRGIWFLTVLGSLATTQREYVALHAFRRLNLQMQNAILQPSLEHFPKYEEQPPAMPECFTPNFVDYLGRTFNTPQLEAIKWAAMHTAAGASNGMSKKQDPWPFTLVQGPPGTGKTHTVWGMLNVIHLVQYQHYYNALVKKLAPESYKQTSKCNSDNISAGSIDEVLQSMDQNLFRTLPKLCPKPRMLVCAPSNAATNELLARVLDRGFIDGEMKVYRPDVTRLRGREAQLSQQMACLQRDLNVAAAARRAQGSVGVDPDILPARDQKRDSLLQSLAAVVENRDKVLVEISRLVILEGKFRAAQASEVGILPPLSLGAARCVLVGDPQQLPATVISKAAGTLLYSRSLFERFQQTGCPTMLLSVQYRMHPQIRDFPSRSGSVSYQNIHEAQVCLRMHERLQKTLKSLEEGKDIYINTVDAFQGQERDVIIMSCVRASNHGVGFVADIRRMNVALTRARRALWVMGNASSLVKSDDWAALISDAKARNCYLDVDSLPKDFLVSKDPAYASLPGKSRSGTPSEDDEKSNASLSKNGNYQPSKPPMENYLDDIDLS